jgi:multidrug efflux pump subunit AcrB
VTVERTPAVIQRDAVSRRVDIEAGVDGRSLGDVKTDIENRLQDLRFPLEYHAEVLTPTTSKEIGSATMIGFGIAAVIATFLLLQAAFRSWGLAAVVLASLPAAIAGGALVALVDGADLTLGATAGFLALFGLAARNAVLMVGGLQADRRGEGELDRARRQRGARALHADRRHGGRAGLPGGAVRGDGLAGRPGDPAPDGPGRAGRRS